LNVRTHLNLGINLGRKLNPNVQMTKLSEADEAYLADVPSFQREAARKELEAKYVKTETKETPTPE
jgi:hypothetical protein